MSQLAGTFLVRHWPPSGGPGVVSLGTLWQGGLEFSSGAETCLFCSPLIAWARQGDRACISSSVPTPSCHLTCLPTGGEATHAHKAEKPGSSVLLLCSPQRLALLTLCCHIPTSSPLSLHPRVQGVQPGFRGVGCISSLSCLVIFSMQCHRPCKGSWRSWRGQLPACKSCAPLGSAPSAGSCRRRCGPGQGCESCCGRPGSACSRPASSGTSSRII